MTAPRRAAAFAAAFWLAMLGWVAADWVWSAPHNRFDEPMPWALNQPPGNTGAHCATAPKPAR